MDEHNNYEDIPAEKFVFAKKPDEVILDKKLNTKPVGYFRDAFRRFKKNRSSVVAAVIILLLFLFALIVPFVSHYDVSFRDGYYKLVPPKYEPLAFLGLDGCTLHTEGQAGYDYYKSIGAELDGSSVKELKNVTYDELTGKPVYTFKVDEYEKVGFVYVDLSEKDYKKLQKYQNRSGIQVMYPIPDNCKTTFLAVSGANLWYELADNTASTTGMAKEHDDNGEPVYTPAYKTSKKEVYMHLLKVIGPIMTLWLTFVIADWVGIASNVRTQFYRFKGQEYILAARTLGASDRRLIFRHILPNSLGTIITGTILIIPGIISSEIILSYLGIVSFRTSDLVSMGTLLSQGESYLSTYPHMLLFPAIFIALLEIAFNLFGNGLRDAFDPSLRGSEE